MAYRKFATPCLEPGCRGHVALKQGRNGPFYGCTMYARTGCTWTAKLTEFNPEPETTPTPEPLTPRSMSEPMPTTAPEPSVTLAAASLRELITAIGTVYRDEVSRQLQPLEAKLDAVVAALGSEVRL